MKYRRFIQIERASVEALSERKLAEMQVETSVDAIMASTEKVDSFVFHAFEGHPLEGTECEINLYKDRLMAETATNRFRLFGIKGKTIPAGMKITISEQYPLGYCTQGSDIICQPLREGEVKRTPRVYLDLSNL